MASSSEGISWGGIGVRFVMALVLVYATWNPTGTSFTHWVFLPIFGDAAAGAAGAAMPDSALVNVPPEESEASAASCCLQPATASSAAAKPRE